MAEMQIRPATESDCPAIALLRLEGLATLSALAPAGFGTEVYDKKLLPVFENELAEACADPDCDLLVAESAGQLLGFVIAVVEQHSDELVEAPYITVQNIGVTRTHRNQGIARLLKTAVEDAAKRRGITTIDALVWETNTAMQALNESLGYTTLERRMVKRLK